MEDIINNFQNVTLSRFLIFLFSILLTLFISGAIANLTKNILSKYLSRNIVKLIANIVLYTFYFIGFSVTLTKVVNFNLPAFLAALGVLGAFVFVPTIPVLQNAIAGIVIAFSRPVKVGNYIDAGGEIVLVDDIRLIKTRAISLNGKIIFIPNLSLINSTIVNYSMGKYEKVTITMDIANQQDFSIIKKTIIKTCVEHSRVHQFEQKFKRNFLNQYFNDEEFDNDLSPKCYITAIAKEKYALEVAFWISDFAAKKEIVNELWIKLEKEFRTNSISFG